MNYQQMTYEQLQKMQDDICMELIKRESSTFNKWLNDTEPAFEHGVSDWVTEKESDR